MALIDDSIGEGLYHLQYGRWKYQDPFEYYLRRSWFWRDCDHFYGFWSRRDCEERHRRRLSTNVRHLRAEVCAGYACHPSGRIDPETNA